MAYHTLIQVVCEHDHKYACSQQLWIYGVTPPRSTWNVPRRPIQMGRPLNKRFFDPVPDSVGEGVASYTFTNRGSYTTLPTVTVSAPSLPGGETATGTLTLRAASATVTVGGADYVQGDILTVAGGTASTAATFEVATVDGAGAVLTVTLLNAGSYTALPTNPVVTTTDSVAGADATLTVTYEVFTFTVVDGGSGYVSSSDAALTFDPASTTAATAVLTTTGTNVILANAFVRGGTQELVADIVRQRGTRTYVMATTEGESLVTLVANANPTEGQAYIQATDSLGSTYFVTKITSRLAVLTQWTDGGTGFVHASGTTAPWSLDGSLDPTGITVTIESA
jgi:hypothetical protein